MAERFENLEDSIPDWENDNVEKCLSEAVDKCKQQEEETEKRFLFENEFPEFFTINKFLFTLCLFII